MLCVWDVALSRAVPCPGSPLVAPTPFTSPCSRRLSWLQTRAQLLGKLGGTEIVARGAVCHHVGERGVGMEE